MTRVFLALVTLAAIGCTSTAGPFITQIRSGGPGQLIVDKCFVEFTKMDNTVSNKDCTTEMVALEPPPMAGPAYAPRAAPAPPAPPPMVNVE